MDNLNSGVDEIEAQNNQSVAENLSGSASGTSPQENPLTRELGNFHTTSGGDDEEKVDTGVTVSSTSDSKTVTSVSSDVRSESPTVHLSAANPLSSNTEQLQSCTDSHLFDEIQTTSHPDYIYHIKWIKFRGNRRPVVTQNENGPCPIIAIANVLLLRGAVDISEGSEVISGHRLVALLSDFLLSQSVASLDDGQLLNYETTVSDALNLFPSLQTGLDVNVRFTGVTSFEYTPALGVFDLFKIPIYHGWLVDPDNFDLVSAVGNLTYNQLVERIIQLKASSDPKNVTKGLIAEDFLHTTASQLTYHGLFILSSTVSDNQLAVFFRNNHFNTIFKHDGRIYVLVTDMGLLSEPSVVWEVLNAVDGDTEFVDSSFQLYHPDTTSSTVISSSIAPTSEQPNNDNDEAALSTKKSADSISNVCAEQDFPPTDYDQETSSDLDFARRLQLEELDNANRKKHPVRSRCTDSAAGPPFSSASSTSQRPYHRSSSGGDRRDCCIL